MTRNEITAELSRVANGQAFITTTQLARAMGRADPQRVKREYLSGIEAVDGRLYLIREVAEVLKSRCKL